MSTDRGVAGERMGLPRHAGAETTGGAMVRGSLSARRRRYGYLLAVVGAATLVVVLVPLRGRLDLAIMFKTIPRVLFADGAY